MGSAHEEDTKPSRKRSTRTSTSWLHGASRREPHDMSNEADDEIGLDPVEALRPYYLPDRYFGTIESELGKRGRVGPLLTLLDIPYGR
jgi:hypothetical protein